MPIILPYVECLQFFYAPGIRKALKEIHEAIEAEEGKMLAVKEELKKCIETLQVVVVEVIMENNGGSRIDMSRTMGLALSVGETKKKFILNHLPMREEKTISLTPRSSAVLTYASKPLAEADGQEIRSLFPLAEVKVVTSAKTSGHGFLGLRHLAKSNPRMLGDDIRKRDEEELLSIL